MRNGIVLVLLVVVVGLSFPTRGAADEYDDSQANPLRLLAYIVHPVGVALEWIIARPMHALADANKTTRKIFGHEPHRPVLADWVSDDELLDQD